MVVVQVYLFQMISMTFYAHYKCLLKFCNSLQHYTKWLPFHNMKVAICCGVYLFGVTGLYFFAVNNPAFIVHPKCHCNMLPKSEGT